MQGRLQYDADVGFRPRSATLSAVAVLIFAVAATAVSWGIAVAMRAA